jgi:crossover junction endodeoxyribonuclease RuvC
VKRSRRVPLGPRAAARAPGSGSRPLPAQLAALLVRPTAQPVRRVLGLDPGSVRTGWGVVELVGQRVHGIAAGVIRAPERAPIAARLQQIHAGVCAVLKQYQPQAVAIEDIFFARHAQAALILGHARGVALLAAAQAELPVTAYPPAVVKRAIVGSGRADKQQVAQLVAAVLQLKELPSVDATDALAIALTHINTTRLGI